MKKGIKFLNDKITELELLIKGYNDAITEKSNEIAKLDKQIFNYKGKKKEVEVKLEPYKLILAELQKEDNTQSISYNANTTNLATSYPNGSSITNCNTVTDINHPNNKNFILTKQYVYAVVCKDTDEFIKYTDSLKNAGFNSTIKNTITEQSDGLSKYIKISSPLDITGVKFDFLITLPLAKQNNEYRNIVNKLNYCLKTNKEFYGY